MRDMHHGARSGLPAVLCLGFGLSAGLTLFAGSASGQSNASTEVAPADAESEAEAELSAEAEVGVSGEAPSEEGASGIEDSEGEGASDEDWGDEGDGDTEDDWGDEGGDDDWGDGGGDDWGDEGGGGFGEPAFTLNGSLTLQGGVFAPLISDRFEPHENEAYLGQNRGAGTVLQYDRPCDPIETPHQNCYPVNHGQKPGSLSIGRATMLLEAHYAPNDKIAVHAIVRGVRSLKLTADRFAQIPTVIEDFDGDQRGAYAQDWVHRNYYTEFDLREFYVDAFPSDWFSMRIGRQQVAWGETSSFRLLDVVNPTDNTWHFGPLESFEDMRIPLWMANFTLDVEALRGALELLWVPLLDRPQDTVNVPLTFAGAWGVPYTDAPTAFFVPRKYFLWPGGRLSDSRVGARWKGELGHAASFSLVYFYTHQIGLPIPIYMTDGGINAAGIQVKDTYVLEYPRNHVAGATLEWAIPQPIGTTLRLEASVVPNNVIPSRTDSGWEQDPNIAGRQNYLPKKKLQASYAVSLQRATMVRFLNPTQNILMFAQFSHTIVPNLDIEGDDAVLVRVPLYNDWAAQKHSFAVVGMMKTSYMHGVITPRITGAWIPNIYEYGGDGPDAGSTGDSGFYSIDVDFRLGTYYRLNVRMTDFVGKVAYRDLGLFRDRDELHAALTIQY